MSKIDLNNGQLILGNYIFPSALNENRTEPYQNLNEEAVFNNRKCQVFAYYKNSRLRRIHIHLDTFVMNHEFKKIEDELRDKDEHNPEINYLNEYVDFCKMQTEKTIDFLTQTKKRNFHWGKIKVIVDPRGPSVFSEIKYHKIKYRN